MTSAPGPHRTPEELSNAGVMSAALTPELEDWVNRAGKAQQAMNEMGVGTVEVVKTPTIYLACHAENREGVDVLAARTTLESAQAFCEERAVAETEYLEDWRQMGSGSWLARVRDTIWFYEILTLPVLP